MLLGVVLATFLLHHALPGDPAAAVLGKHYTAADAHALRERLGLNDPLPVQFARYVGDLLRGDLGTSHVSNHPVEEDLARVLPATLELSVCALALATVFGVGLGVVTALRPRSLLDLAGLTGSLAGVSMPIFWLGLLALQAFGKGGLLVEASGGAFGGLPLGRRFNPAEFPLDQLSGAPGCTGLLLYDTLFVARSPAAFRHVLEHLLLPAIVLATVPTAVVARITRAALGEVLLQDYIRTARAKGLSELRVVLRHALRNAAIPIVTSLGTLFGYLLGGAVLTETVFQWPGMGTYVVSAIRDLDVRPLQACVLLVAVSFLGINLFVDLSYAWLDPRVRRGSTS
ncbi:MAG: ABC transporter permease [Planctomycetota bacterium]|nr:MAG: ABC transporter permease [Planctomycetota bacterium]